MTNPIRFFGIRGTSYVEYFIAATAMALATAWLASNLNTAVVPYQSSFNTQMAAIRGPVR